MQKIIKILILFIFLFVIGIFYTSLTRDTNYNTSSLINKETPEFKIVTFDDSNYYTKDDIKNWRSNQKNSGFLPEERAWMTKLIDQIGLVDAFRVKCKQNDIYTWWSNRGNAYNNNVGWRIDYQMVTSNLLDKINKVYVYKGKKFSDHAPLVIDYDI